MKKLIIVLLFALFFGFGSAQQLFRSQFAPFDAREDAAKSDYSRTVGHIIFAPQKVGSVEGTDIYSQKVTAEAAWNDYNTMLHIQSVGSAYDVAINGVFVAGFEEGTTPVDLLVSPYLVQGQNDILVLLRTSTCPELNAATAPLAQQQFSGSYIYQQHRTAIFDYDVAIVEREGKLHLELDIIADNSFNFQEPITLGYDIYSPENKLIDYAVNQINVDGRSRDTMRVRVNLGAESRFLWSAAKPSLYRATLYIKRNGKPAEYIPLYIGAGSTTASNGVIYRNGKAISLQNSTNYNAPATRELCRKELIALKAKGTTVLKTSAPQPLWFYNLCDQIGLYVIEGAAINPTHASGDRKVGGTPSNNPALVWEYIARVKSMYYRTRNHACIIAYSLAGAEAGNGYCLYKAYQWLKGVEKQRAVICNSAAGEWNSDL